MTTPATPWRELPSTSCSIARTMALLGDPWSVVIVRDLLHGVRRFDELVEHLGIARTVLSRRLAALAEAGLVETSDYREPGRRTRHEYRLTPAGRDLEPVLLALLAYGDAHLAGPEGPPVRVEHVGGGGEVRQQPTGAHGHTLGPTDRVCRVPH